MNRSNKNLIEMQHGKFQTVIVISHYFKRQKSFTNTVYIFVILTSFIVDCVHEIEFRLLVKCDCTNVHNATTLDATQPHDVPANAR